MSNLDAIHPNGYYKARIEGILEGTAIAGQTTNFDWTVPYERVLNGADYIASNFNSNDRVSFQVVHPSTFEILDEFVKDLFVRERLEKELYGARILAGLIIRIVYKNNGANDAYINVNLDLHEVA